LTRYNFPSPFGFGVDGVSAAFLGFAFSLFSRVFNVGGGNWNEEEEEEEEEDDAAADQIEGMTGGLARSRGGVGQPTLLTCLSFSSSALFMKRAAVNEEEEETGRTSKEEGYTGCCVIGILSKMWSTFQEEAVSKGMKEKKTLAREKKRQKRTSAFPSFHSHGGT
jgi:hypothetical protein